MTGRRWWAGLAVVLCGTGSVKAIAPIVSGDVPTAPLGLCELSVGYVLRDDGGTRTHEAPFWELVCGVTARQELTIEAPLLVRDGIDGTSAGFGDTVIGTKLRLLGEPAADSGLSVSAEIKLPSGDSVRGLGSGAADADLRVRWGHAIGGDSLYGNLGHTWVGERRGERLDDTPTP